MHKYVYVKDAMETDVCSAEPIIWIGKKRQDGEEAQMSECEIGEGRNGKEDREWEQETEYV